MKYIMVALKDCGTQAFLQPQAVVHKNAMIRALTDGLRKAEKDERAPDWSRHPEDFELYTVGEYDAESGVCTSPPGGKPALIVRLKDLVER